MGQLQGKVCVTGGAGSVGLASARLFVQEGAKVMLVDLTDAELRRAHATLKSENVSYVAADVSKADDTQRYIDKTVATFGKIDVLFSNAGNFGVVRPIHEYPEDVFDSVYAVHVKGAFLAAKYGVPQMNDGGSMIITSSYNNCRLQRGVRLRPEAATAQIHRASTGRRARLAACGGRDWAMAKQAVVVRYRVKPGRMGEVLPLLRAHVARTKAEEPGCVQFDILLPHSEADTVHLYEVYADQAALELHNASKGLATYKSQTDPLLFERAVTWCTVEE